MATSLIKSLGGASAVQTVSEGEDPLVEVAELEGEECDFVIYIQDRVAHEHSGLMERMLTALGRQRGVTEAFREDRERVLLQAPDWTFDRIKEWATSFLVEHLAR